MLRDYLKKIFESANRGDVCLTYKDNDPDKPKVKSQYEKG